MRIIKLLWKIFNNIIRQPKSIIKIIDENEEKQRYVIKKYGNINGLPVIDILELIPNFEEVVNPYSFLEATTAPVEIALLKALAKKYDKCQY